MKLMIAAVLFVVFAPSIYAQDNAAIKAAKSACGPDSIGFDVHRDKHDRPTSQPELGKALIYFVQSGLKPFTSRIGIDGKWAGSTQRLSYFYVSVEPGEHHICADVQPGHSHYFRQQNTRAALISLTVEPGRAYFVALRVIDVQADDPKSGDLSLQMVNSGEGPLIISRSYHSVFVEKK